MKKVGLAVVTYMSNYGSYLQSFATQEAIKSLGYETEVISIDGVSQIISKARKKYFVSKIFNFDEVKSYAVALRGILQMKFNKQYAESISTRERYYQDFKKRFTFSPSYNKWESIGNYSRQYSSVVVGSDQLWRPANIEGGYYTLEFVPDEVNKIAYSTSFGVKNLPKKQALKAKWFLPRINHLSVREESGRELIRRLTNIDVPVVCDPTMLLSKNEWESFLDNKSKWEGENYILCYFLGQNEKYLEFAKQLKEKTGYSLIGVVHCAGYNKKVDYYYDETPFDMGPLDFIDAIRNAKYVLTDSFHCCVFSILFHTDFYAFRRFADGDRMSTNDRLATLFSWTGLTKRMLTGEETIDDDLLSHIDFSEIDEKVSNKRAESKVFLAKSLNDGK